MMLAAADDDAFRTNLGFPFRYWATELAAGAMVNVSSNGFINLDGFATSNRFPALPGTATPNATVAAYWGDNVNRGNQCVVTLGAAPTRRQVFLWSDQYHCCTEEPTVHLTYEVILNESGPIDVLYQTMTGARAVSAGLENQAGTAGVPGCPDGTSYTCTPTSGLRVRYNPVP
jgi:hypothetical protein